MCCSVQDLVKPIVLLTLTYTVLQLLQFLWSPNMWHGRHGTWLSCQLQRPEPSTVEVVAQTSHDGTSEIPHHLLRPFHIISTANLSLCFSGKEMALPCALNMEVIHLDFLCCLLCGFLITDVDQKWLTPIWFLLFYTKYLSQEEMEPVGSEFNL